MAKRDFRGSSDPFGGEEQPVDTSPEAIADQIYGSSILGDLAAVDARNERIQRINIFDIVPDPTQPRRVIPAVIRDQWDGSPEGVKDMFMLWWGAINSERADAGYPHEFDLGAYLESGVTERSEDNRTAYSPSPLEVSFLKIVSLAASVHHKGLTNPITVAADGARFRLETGERRWLAYHLLNAWFTSESGVDGPTWGPHPRAQSRRGGCVASGQ